MLPEHSRPLDVQTLRESLTGPLAKALRAFCATTIHPGSPEGVLKDWTIALKDNIDIAGEMVQVGSLALKDRKASTTASAVDRVLAAGATLMGRTRVIELCWGSWGLSEHFVMPRNPWDSVHERVPGGSSSGSAVAVAARLTRAALGTDTGGSIRMPAALCGITGFKPTKHTVPIDGVVPLAPSYDSLGPMALTAADCAILYSVLASESIAPPISSGKIALLTSPHHLNCCQSAVVDNLMACAQTFMDAGFEVIEVSDCPNWEQMTRHAEIAIAAQAWEQFGSIYRAHPEGFSKALQERMEIAHALAPEIVESVLHDRIGDIAYFDRWMSGYDALLTPTVPCTAPLTSAISERDGSIGQFVRWVNHVEGCAISMPSGLDAQGLPTAIQLVGPAGSDQCILGIAQTYEQLTQWHRLVPPLQDFLPKET